MAETAMTNAIHDEAHHILVVDDDTRIRELLTEFLSRNNYRVTAAESAADARRKMVGLEFDLLILDVMMPGEDGVSFARAMREELRDVPILMLTARSETEERIEGLEAGADDYLSKPFDPRELLLRVSNIVRRTAATELPAIEQVVFGPYSFFISKRELKKNGEPVKLTDRERNIMVRFANTPGDTIPRHELVEDATEIGERTIDVQINRLRRKVEDDPANPRYLQTVRGIGYRLCIE
ncbi:response regulator [Ahrensia marina]|jgi:two-component system phosphate regulon response regulator OmpR|uniref:Chemotaxis protein CheY n=1 Tax=Ahrensia marina TaxID=1514904 RepID=A0A0M9GQD9_9HYPH|nr:response regulator [Ahrensia marina]KPB02946.1 chemotaxis protein CheY [Ahrensia marina]